MEIERRLKGRKEKSLAVMDPVVLAIGCLVVLSADQVDLVRADCYLGSAGQAATAVGSMFQAVVAEAVLGIQSVDQSELVALEQGFGLAEMSYVASDTLHIPLYSLSSYLHRKSPAHRENAVGPSMAAGMGLNRVAAERME